MRKLYILLIVLAFLSGIALYFFGFTLPQIPVLTSLWTQIKTVISEPKTLLTAGVSTAAASLSIGKILYNKMKKTQQIATDRIQDLQGDVLQENKFKNEFQAEVNTLKNQTQIQQTTITNLQNQLLEQQKSFDQRLAEKQGLLDSKIAEYNLAVRTLAEKSKIKEEPTRVS